MDAGGGQRFDQNVPRCYLLGTGVAGSLRGAPAGLLLEYGHVRIGFDGGPGSEPPEHVSAWLVCDPEDPAMPGLRYIAHMTGMPEPERRPYDSGPVHVRPMDTGTGEYGYHILCGHHLITWVPRATGFPGWAEGSALMFADGAEAERISRTAAEAQRHEVQRLVYGRLGDQALARMAAGRSPPFGEWGEEGRLYRP